MSFNQVEFGYRLRRARRERGFTQERLADALNISADHLGKLELGRRGVSIDLLIDISNALHVTLDYLIKGDERDPFRMEKLIGQIHNILNEMESIT